MNREDEDKQKGLIFNIQRFAIQDGPGIRTTVFFKGCPLRCRWCSNPESQQPFPEIITRDIKCIKCGKCAEACPQNAITITPERRKINWAKCNQCLKCADVCPTGAISVVGQYMTVDEVVAEAEADKLFYQNSGGGVTLSGGEPLYEWEFARQVLKACKQKSLHTALDTCGYAPWHAFEEVLQYVDLVLFDIKHMDPQRHKQGTGKSNSLILANAQKTASMVRTWLRAPLIPTYNDSEVHLREVAEFARKIGVEKLSLLPYHNLGEAKYEQMGRRYPLKREQIEAPNSQSLEQAKTLIEALGTAVTIGR